ncbi:DMT family transporter [Candidatus Odyssella thessalonicensis]|uniref:DMT family transporter n=1 Tax=Candidatus Odyssella thessalonicensis TaxID=84647 RepID=UPI000225B487|nr:DMT family transporter [Candidatus Odyssella thessalonicensis]
MNLQHCRFRAIFWIFLWSALFSVAMATAKTLDSSINQISLIFVRSLVAMIAALPLFMRSGFKVHFATSRLGLHLIRIILVFCSMGCTYYAYRHLPIAYAASIGQTGPLFTTILAILLLKEQVSTAKWLALILGYGGVIVMVRPNEGGMIDLATWVALAANLLAGLTIIVAKKLTKTDSSETILFYATFGVLAVSALMSIWFWQTPSVEDLGRLSILGIAGVLSQYCYLRALKCAPASFITPFEYTRLCMSIPIGYFMFSEIPDRWTIAGSLIIIVAIVMLTLADREKGTES